MSHFTVIVMTDSKDDSDAIVSAVSKLQTDKDVERDAEQEATIQNLLAERSGAIEAAVTTERDAMKKSIGMLKFPATKIEPGKSVTLRVVARYPFCVTALKVSSESVSKFTIDDLSFVRANDLEAREDSRTMSPVPAATFSDEGIASLFWNVEIRSAKITVTNIGKRAHTIRASLVGLASHVAIQHNSRYVSEASASAPFPAPPNPNSWHVENIQPNPVEPVAMYPTYASPEREIPDPRRTE